MLSTRPQLRPRGADGGPIACYRIIGDPLAPLLGAPAAAAAARTVFAPGPDDALPVISLADWGAGA